MTSYALFLRGINLGSINRVAMADLRALLTELGYDDVRTHLQSGNAVFSASDTTPAKLERAIEAAITERLALSIRCVVRTADELRAVIDANPFQGTATNPARFLVVFFSGVPDPADIAALDAGDFAPDEYRFGERELYLWCPDGVGTSKLAKAATPKPRNKVVGTARNWNTVTKLLAMTDA